MTLDHQQLGSSASMVDKMCGDRGMSVAEPGYPCTWQAGACVGAGGRYELRAVLGEGGEGVVHEAFDNCLGRSVAIKVLHRASGARSPCVLLAQARTMARLRHENIAMVYDYFAWRGVPCVVMERVHGPSLNSLIAQRTLTKSQSLSLAIALSDALEYAHAEGVLHLDLKPANILVAEMRVKVVDFCSCESQLRPDDAFQDAIVAGTPRYMAPEQWGPRPLDARTDIWAIGVILYEMLCGCLPYSERTPGIVASRPGEAAAQWAKCSLPTGIDRVLRKALAVSPDARFQDAASLGAALKRLARELRSAPDHDPTLPGGVSLLDPKPKLRNAMTYDKALADNHPPP